MWASGRSGHIRRAPHGYEPTREVAMAAFAKSWRRQWARHANRTQPLNRESCDCDYKTRKESAEAAENQNVIDFGHRCVEEFGFGACPILRRRKARVGAEGGPPPIGEAFLSRQLSR
jgi:hypothetical protein